MNKTSNIIAVAAACVAVGLFSGPSLAQKPFLNTLRTVYNLQKEKNASCKLCHEFDKEKGESADKDNLNSFGKELLNAPEMKPVIGKGDEHKFTADELKAVEAAAKATGGKDSDGDGATNLEELTLGTFPGNAKSTPTAEELAAYRKK